jgi:hypothetical protein
MEVSGQIHATVALRLGKSPRNPVNRRLDRIQNRSESLGEEKNLLPLPGIEK